jgi:hypothetical protein
MRGGTRPSMDQIMAMMLKLRILLMSVISSRAIVAAHRGAIE